MGNIIKHELWFPDAVPPEAGCLSTTQGHVGHPAGIEKTPNRDQLNNFLTGHSINGGLGYYGGASVTYSPSTKSWGGGIGVYSLQVGISYNYTPSFLVIETGEEW